VFTRVLRWRRAMAQYNVGHERYLTEIRARLARLPNVHLAGNAYMGIGIPDCIRSAQIAAREITGEALEESSATPAEVASGG
jgi:oxygen-dependent protoporphyrinogen oxidase